MSHRFTLLLHFSKLLTISILPFIHAAILIKHNVDINLCGGLREHTPIQYACLKGHTDIVKLLLDNNCEVIDNNGLSPALHSACKMSHLLSSKICTTSVCPFVQVKCKGVY
jgi:ankyrin repeat protein